LAGNALPNTGAFEQLVAATGCGDAERVALQWLGLARGPAGCAGRSGGQGELGHSPPKPGHAKKRYAGDQITNASGPARPVALNRNGLATAGPGGMACDDSRRPSQLCPQPRSGVPDSRMTFLSTFGRRRRHGGAKKAVGKDAILRGKADFLYPVSLGLRPPRPCAIARDLCRVLLLFDLACPLRHRGTGENLARDAARFRFIAAKKADFSGWRGRWDD